MAPGKAHCLWNGTFTEDEKSELFRFRRRLRRWPRCLRNLRPGTDVGTLSWSSISATTWRTTSFIRSTASAWRTRWRRGRRFSMRASSILPIACPTIQVARRESKYVLRRLMEKKLPHRCCSGRRLVLTFLSMIGSAEFSSPAAGNADGRSRYFDWLVPLAVCAPLAGRSSGAARNLGYHFWGLLVLFIWMKRWGIETAIEGPAVTAPQASSTDSVRH